MKKIETVAEMQRGCAALRAAGRTIALVVTGGSIHEGHLALIRAAREKAEVVVVSLFPNPLQFGASEGFAHYPRTTEADVARCEEAGVDLVFLPAQEEMYPRTFSTFVTEETISKRLCGISRPTHFRGVTTVMVKLINIVRPDVLVMGQKDAQQVAVTPRRARRVGRRRLLQSARFIDAQVGVQRAVFLTYRGQNRLSQFNR